MVDIEKLEKTTKIFESIYQNQLLDIHENPVLSNWANIMDQEENWILESCPDLYIIEKASDELQRKIRRMNLDKGIIIEIIQQIKDDVKETGEGAIRIVTHNRDFGHNGSTGGSDGLTDDNYTKNINYLAKQINKCIIDNHALQRIEFNKSFLFSLSLSFQGQGGHFGLVLGELTKNSGGGGEIKVSILDPYNFYTATFRHLAKSAFDILLDDITSYPAFQGYILAFEPPINVHYLQSVSRDATLKGLYPKNDNDEYAIQSYWGQDNFCFMWCVFFAHNFIINKKIENARGLYREIQENDNINLVIIKAYILQLFNKLDITVGPLFKEYFKFIWTCYTLKKNGSTFDGTEPPGDQTRIFPNPLPSPHQYATYEINWGANDFLTNPTVAGLNLSRRLKKGSIPKLEFLDNKTGSVIHENYNSIKIVNNDKCKDDILKYITPPSKITDYNLRKENSVFQLLYHYYSKNYGIFNADEIYRKYTIGGDIKELPCAKSPEDINQILDLNLLPKMTRNSILKSYRLACNSANTVIRDRNVKYTTQRTSMDCNIPTILFPYQKKAVETMIEKSKHPNPNPTGRGRRIPGLLVWFGTGTGKTLTANTVAKITTACENNHFEKCFIISTKSVFRQFATSLSLDSFLTPDELRPNPDNKQTIYFARHGPRDIYVFSTTTFQSLFEDTTTGMVKEKWGDILSKSLIILDEAHKVVNIKNRLEGKYLFFNSCCKLAKQVMLLTATPMVNSTSDIEPLLALIDGRDPIPTLDFKGKFVGIIKVESDMEHICPAENPPALFSITNCVFDLTDTTTYIPPTTGWRTADGMARWQDRIIYKESDITILPPCEERKLCVFTDDSELLEALVGRLTDELDNILTNTASAFGSAEFGSDRYVNIKCEKILEIIKQRETTLKSDNITTLNLTTDFDPKQINFKYVIYSQYKKFINKFKTHLINFGIDKNLIGEITGDTEGDTRQKAADDYNAGDIKILLITDAAVEGIDLKRTGMIILAEPVWTKAKYDQIKGRGVRVGSNLRLNDKDSTRAKKTLEDAKTEHLKVSPVSEQQRISQEYDTITSALGKFADGDTASMYRLSGNIFYKYIKGKLDFSTIPDKIDCMTFVLSYSMRLSDPSRIKYSIDTFKYNAMRLKYTETRRFYNETLQHVTIKY